MVLLLHEDLANLFCHRVFSKRFTLPDAIAVIANGFVFIIEVVPEHIFRIFRCAYRLGRDRWHFCRDSRSAARGSGHDRVPAWRGFPAWRQCPYIWAPLST